MLRLTTAAAAEADGTPATQHIARDFADPYLELVRLLHEASEIEHALLVQYLYAAFSVKDRYATVIGTGGDDAISIVGVAIQEMHHLARVNELLGLLHAAPNLVRQDFPYEPDIYPFALTLEPLSRRSCAKYVYAESTVSDLDPDDPANADAAAQEFIAAVLAELGDGARLNHIGSLYGSIIDVLNEVIALDLPGLPDLSTWPGTLEDIRQQGEGPHYEFFRKLFTGEAFGTGTDVWSLDPSDEAYPANDIGTDLSAFHGHPRAIPEPDRTLAWLTDLHYWLVLGLLDLDLRTGDGTVGFQAVRHMTSALRPLGTLLAARGVGTPFDPLSMGYAPGHDIAGTVGVLRHLAQEAAAVTAALAPTLPAGLPQRLDALTRSTVSALDAVAAPPEPAGGAAPGGGGDTDAEAAKAAKAAMDFWFDFDNSFADAPTLEAVRAMSALGTMDTLADQFVQRVGEGTVATAFRDDVAPLRPALTTLSRLQLAVFDAHFTGDDARRRVAFEHFGQGDLFDERRPGNEVHMMDTGALPPIGYRRWWAIIRAMVVLGIDADRWRSIGAHVALAWAVQSEARPRQNRHNTPLPAARLATLRTVWLARTEDEIDAAFASGPIPAPVP